MEITGGTPLVGTDVDSHIDHRIAMSLAIAPLTLLAQLPFTVPKLLLSLTLTSLLPCNDSVVNNCLAHAVLSIPESAMKPVHKTLSLPDIQLSYLEWNQSQEPLLLLHGAGGDALVWSSLAVTLANRYHIVALDMRGHGESSKPQGNYPYSDADFIADLEALMKHLGWSSAHIVGHSWTGKLVAIWAVQHPERLRSMILVDPVDFVPQPCPIDIPSLFVQPEKGVNCTDSHLEPYETYLKNLRICKVPGNHWPFLVQPEVFNRTVEAFLEEQRR